MYERCREAYRAKGKGQRARGSTYETGIHIYSFNGRIFFCIMQSARGAPIASTSSENIGSNSTREEKRKAKGAKGKERRRKGRRESATFLRVAESGADGSKHENRGGDRGLQETTPLKRRIIIIVAQLWRAPNC